MNGAESNCRIAVYDADAVTEAFLGYQNSLFWVLDKGRFDKHAQKDTGLDGKVMGEFSHILSVGKPPAERIRVEVEILEDGKVKGIAAKYLYERVGDTRIYVPRELVDE